MPDRKPKPERTTPHKDKLCKACRRPIQWQKKWEQDWDVVKFCSESCSGYRSGEKDAALEAAILELLAERGADDCICSSEAAKLVGGSGRDKDKASRRDWEALLLPARAAARRLAVAGKVEVMQHGRAVDPAIAKGPILLRLR